MTEPDPRIQAHAFVDSIQKMLAFAEQQDDFLLAARLEEVRITIVERHLPVES